MKFDECPSCIKKPQNLGKAIHYRSSESCKVGYGFAHGLSKYGTPGSRKPVGQTRAIVHAAHWATTPKLQTIIIIAGIE